MKRESLKMTAENWQQLTEVAASTGSIYSGQPSWRRLVLRIARGEVQCAARVTKRRSRKSENVRMSEGADG